MGNITTPLEAQHGPTSSRKLINNHAKCIVELQDEVKELANGWEITEFIGIKDAVFTAWQIRALEVGSSLPA